MTKHFGTKGFEQKQKRTTTKTTTTTTILMGSNIIEIKLVYLYQWISHMLPLEVCMKLLWLVNKTWTWTKATWVSTESESIWGPEEENNKDMTSMLETRIKLSCNGNGLYPP